MSSQIKWITAHLFYSAMQCPRLSWLSFKNNIPVKSGYTHFFADEIQYIIQLLTANDPHTQFIDSDLPIQSRYDATILQLNRHGNIANGCLCWQQFTCKIDLLSYINDEWVLTYVHPGFRLQKKDYIIIAYITHLLAKHSITLSKIQLMTINEHYKRTDTLAINELCITSDITHKIQPIVTVIASKMNVLATQLALKNAPEIPFDLYCIKPNTCQFLSTCSPHLGSNSILKLSGLSKQKKVNLVQNNVTSIHDIALHTTLSHKQAIQVSCKLDQKPFYDDKLIKTFLNELHFPLYFMDFEIAQFIVPPFKGLRPLHQLPFQYSIHILDHIDAEPIHIDFLHQFSDNPEPYFAQKLTQDIPKNVPIIVFNDNLEKLILRYLQTQFSSYAACLQRISTQLIDISHLFINNAYYHPKMNGKYSLKNIYAAIAENDTMQFKSLHIQNGEAANIAYKRYLYETDTQQRHMIVNQLSDYCQLDTYAMVKIIKHLFQVIN